MRTFANKSLQFSTNVLVFKALEETQVQPHVVLGIVALGVAFLSNRECL